MLRFSKIGKVGDWMKIIQDSRANQDFLFISYIHCLFIEKEWDKIPYLCFLEECHFITIQHYVVLVHKINK